MITIVVGHSKECIDKGRELGIAIAKLGIDVKLDDSSDSLGLKMNKSEEESIGRIELFEADIKRGTLVLCKYDKNVEKKRKKRMTEKIMVNRDDLLLILDMFNTSLMKQEDYDNQLNKEVIKFISKANIINDDIDIKLFSNDLKKLMKKNKRR